MCRCQSTECGRYIRPVENSSKEEQTTAPRLHARARANGVAGNARLTATTAAILLVLLAAEGFTILSVRQMLSAHIFIGLLVLPPIVVKLTSTMYRFVRYYLRDPAYLRKGPPPIILRLLGPGVILDTIALFGTGILTLYVRGGQLSTVLFLHRASFVLWFCAMAIHVLGHLGETARIAPRDFLARSRGKVAGAGARNIVVLLSLGVGLLLAAALVNRGNFFLNAIH